MSYAKYVPKHWFQLWTTEILTFILAVFVLEDTPRPSLLSILGIDTAFGFKIEHSYGVRVVVLANIACLMAVSGLRDLLLAFPQLDLVTKNIISLLSEQSSLQNTDFNPQLQSIDYVPRIGFFWRFYHTAFNPEEYAVVVALFSSCPLYKQSVIMVFAFNFCDNIDLFCKLFNFHLKAVSQ